MINLRTAEEKDIQLITDLMTKAFNYDTAFYFGTGVTGGPPGYSDGKLAEKILNNPNLDTFLIVKGNSQIVGFISLDETNQILVYFCISPNFINKGIGTATWKIVENRYTIKSWKVETPSYSKRNHHFYEKLGFKKYGERSYGEDSKSFLFRQEPS
ncbi:GNAT family N-acetyltransferase [Sporolactobacillus kofuensis]|uniref:GNAT family N-acetyltransferase n=1 Tax=Sporolactobacillus kofuensis TaxID=269672 RepID=A0ABW1WDQ2_9BACL|nr:GNAT family N-acetyltransferase [Sporolactobacillus kofuensis]MCO7175466.1 GNAT family N-acetyltransferase [Sporolactobacillus kofuensis]